MFLIVKGLNRNKFEPMIMGREEGDWVNQVKSITDIRFKNVTSLRRQINPYYDLMSIFEIKKLCKDNNIDILHTHSSKPGVVGRLGAFFAGVPVVIHTVHGFSFHEFMPWWQRKLFIFTERVMAKFTSKILFISENDKQTAERLRIGNASTLCMLHYGIEYSAFEKNVNRKDLRRTLGFDDSNYVIGFTGRFSDQKALHILIQSFAKVIQSVPAARLLLVGDGLLRGKLEGLIHQLQIDDKVVITGFRDDVHQLLKLMDLFVMTSFWEGLSRSLVEAMYAKVPVVATNVGGTSNAVRNGKTGRLIPPNDIERTVQAILEARNDAIGTDKMADSAYLWARETFDVQTMHAKIERLYEDLVMQKFDRTSS
jgi:glycosyltransferase involved in cell wall biosynthesis